GGSPGPGGVWTGPNGGHSGLLNPASDPSGTYTYTVAGVPPCVDAPAVVNVDVISTPDAGEDGDTTVCGNADEFDLFSLLGGQPDVTGTWTDPGGNPHSGIFAPGSSQPGGYTYKVPGQGGCADDHATATV